MNELAKIAEESGLPQTKSQALLEIFQEFFGVAAEWEEQAKSIKVTNESQTDLMLKAREGRKFLQEARIKLEKTRVDQKKFALLEGKAIDGMANVLKASIVPVEAYLKEQEDFVVNKAKAEALAKRVKADNLLAEQELAEEKALQKKFEADRLENIRLEEEAEKKAAIAQKERDEAVAKQKLIDDAAREEREKHQKETEQKQREAFEQGEKVRIENEKELAAEREKQDVENKEREEKAKVRQEIGNRRQKALFDIGITTDFSSWADMKDEDWKYYYSLKQKEYVKKREKQELEKQEAETRIAEQQKRAEEAERKLVENLSEGARLETKPTIFYPDSEVKCPKCGHVFKPELKLI